jgi:serine/threonine-protein kinase
MAGQSRIPDLAPGTLLGHQYQIVRQLGQGGMGTVLLATDRELDRPVAIKLLQPNASMLLETDSRFRREARLLSRLNHPNVVVIHAFGAVPGSSVRFIVMEYVPGEGLDARLERAGPLDAETFCSVLAQIGGAVAEAHRHGIVHRDLKPGNVLVSRVADDEAFVKVVDFGLAKMFGERELPTLPGEGDLTVDGTFVGTPNYMAPEQLRSGVVDGRADIYSLAILACQLLTGRLPYDATNLPRMIVAHLTESPLLPSQLRPDLGLPPGVDRAIVRGLAKAPEDRPQRVQDFVAEVVSEVRAWRGLPGGTRISLMPRSASSEQPTRGFEPGSSVVGMRSSDATAPTVVSGLAELLSQRPISGAARAPSEARVARAMTALHVDFHVEPAEASMDREEFAECLSLVASRMHQAIDAARGASVGPLTDRKVAVFGVSPDSSNDTERAIDAALAIRSSLAHLSEDPTVPPAFRFSVRIGIDDGRINLVSSGDGAVVFGAALSDARRLAEAAQPGEVTISSGAFRRVRGLYDCAPERDAGGGAGRIVRAKRALPRDLGAHQIRGVRVDLVGRDAEMSALREAFETVVTGHRARVVSLRGGAGVGKSRLVAELTRELDDRAADVMLELGRSTPGGTGAPYEPFLEAIRSRARLSDADTPEQARFKIEHYVRRHVAVDPTMLTVDDEAIVDVLGDFLGVVSEDDEPRESSMSAGDERRVAMWRGLTDLYRRLSARWPLVFVLEEHHWATAPTRALLRHLTVELRDAPILFLLVMRPKDDVDLAWLESRSDAQILNVAPLDDAATAKLIGHVLREMIEVPAWLVREIAALAQGVPLLVEETIHELLDRRAIVVDDAGKWRAASQVPGKLGLPESVEQLFLSRVEQLDPRLREVLEVAAVAGRRFWASLVATLVSTDVGDAMPELVRRGFVVQQRDGDLAGEPAYGFAQLAVAEAVYRNVPRARRQRLHHAVGEWLEKRARGRELAHRDDAIGWHFREAGEPRRALPYEQRAAERAIRVCAVEQAVTHLGHCRDILRGLSPGEMSGKERRAAELRVAADLVHQSVLAGSLATALALADEELATIPTTASSSGVPPDEAALLARIAIGRGQSLEHLGRYGEARASFVLARSFSGRGDTGVLGLMALTGEAAMSSKLGEKDDCAALLRPALERYESTAPSGAEWERALSTGYRVLANAELRRGDYGNAEEAYRKAYDLALSASAPVAVADSLNGLAALHYYRGRLDKAESTWRLALQTAEQKGLLQHKSVLLNNLGELELKRGATAQARLTLERAAALHAELGSDQGQVDTLRLLGECALAMGQPAEADAAAKRALVIAERVGSPYFLGACHRTLAKIAHGRADGAATRAHLAASLAAFEAAGMAGEVAETRGLSSSFAESTSSD